MSLFSVAAWMQRRAWPRRFYRLPEIVEQRTLFPFFSMERVSG